MTTFRTTPLFGGALIADLPSTFLDVSNIRRVPDNQEVYLDKEGLTSIMFDILERVGPPGSTNAIDGAALTIHLEEIAQSEPENLKIWSIAPTVFSKLPKETPAYTVVATQRPPPDPDSHKETTDFTAIVMTLIRLEKESTDIVIVINVPHVRGEYDEDDVDLEVGKQGKMIENAVEYSAMIWESFKIKDWNLFNDV